MIRTTHRQPPAAAPRTLRFFARIRRFAHCAAPLAALGLALAGCGPDASRVLARVGSRTLTTDEFIEVARGNESQYPGPPDSAKAMLLEDMVRRALLLCDAERLGLFREPAVAGSRGLFEDEELQQAIYRRLAPADIPVSEAEVERLYAARDSAAHVRAIMCLSRGAADAAANELRRGARFEDVADRYGSPAALPPGGDLGYLVPGTLIAPLDRHLREGPVGTVFGPLESPGEGWFLIEVLERRGNTQGPLEEQRAMLRDMLRQRKARAHRTRAIESLRRSYDLRLEPGGAQTLFAFFNRSVGDTSGRGPSSSPVDSAAVLARYRVRGAAATYTLRDAIADLHDVTRDRPNPTFTPSIERWIEDQATRRLAMIEARRLRLHEEPGTVHAVERRLDNRALDVYYDVEIAPAAEATPGDLREAYERGREIFQRLDGVELLVVTLADSAAAATLVSHAGHAPTLHEAVAMAAPGARVSAESVRFPQAPARWRPYEDLFLRMSPHECLGPIPVAEGWLVAQLVSKRQEAPPLEELSPEALLSLRQQAEEISRDRAFLLRTEKLRQEFRPEIHAERLRAIPWPLAPPRAS